MGCRWWVVIPHTILLALRELDEQTTNLNLRLKAGAALTSYVQAANGGPVTKDASVELTMTRRHRRITGADPDG